MVAPQWHGRGLGGRLLSALCDGVGLPRVLLTTQDGPNPARAFYARQGFREVAGGLAYGSTPYLVLARDLS
ncbi:hypothetical protein GCM10025868_07900 [Angustibacter aerolatus]|uniref:N-acetyltransferase domain-containing protein n=1 Tax=Angustibacter aerolatus TaxID=1162965 RepID=A0ABQ6JFF1_9ACTN|nr:GNAT family N-acetyltransferase [Angustibacter aerolatus]GMA85540.1 hypothetical protein GCM10025868_07900 [Angustibacter aerolatus]